MIKKFFRKICAADFQKITAKNIAVRNGVKYVPDANGKRINSSYRKGNRFFLKEGKYILFYPSNDGKPTYPFEWWQIIQGKPKKIIDNQTAFKCITNLSEILLKMVDLYTKYIDEDIFISSEDFAIQLTDEVVPNYQGKGELVLMDASIRNNQIEPKQIHEAKKYFINEFLDHFIGWNFGVVITNTPELERAIRRLNSLTIKRGMRQYAGTGLEVWETKDVKYYDLRK